MLRIVRCPKCQQLLQEEYDVYKCGGCGTVLQSKKQSVAGDSESSQVARKGYEYDVFLSFHRGDTRYSFTGSLWKALDDKGIRTFMDDQEVLRKGEEISPSLMKVVQDSRIAIVVLSKNYASSAWCLEELSYILDCIKDTGGSIWPVFYHIDPSEVRYLKGAYGEAFARHEEKYKDDMEKLQQWSNALTQVSSISGWNSRDREEYQLIQEIVAKVSMMLFHTSLLDIDYVVGMESRLQDVLSLLELKSNSDGALMMGIYGAAGIGKTTLGRVTFNMIAEEFEALCFLPKVRENSNIDGLVYLQNMLLSQVIGEKDSNLSDVHMGALKIKNRLKLKKVLLILDDVDTLEQLEALAGKADWFGPGSRVIVTTRDKHLLAFHEIERTYEVQPLSPIDSLELLSHQVFKQGDVDSSYTGVLNELVSYASGHPLALKVIGSLLSGESVQEWTNVLHRFKRIPPREIQQILKTSFDSLREEEKSLFLDIACCFQGYDFSEALDILHAHHADDVKLHIDVLIDKSLISISSDDKVTLHPLLEDMGKEIVRQESPKEPGRRSRLWLFEDIIQVLKNNTGTSSIEIIHLDSPLVEDDESIEWDGEAFKKMENLKTLIIRKCKFSQAAKYLPKSLRVLEWWRYPLEELPSDFSPNQLVICKLPHMGITSPEMVELPEASQTSSQVLQTSPVVPSVAQGSQRDNLDLQVSPRVPRDPLPTTLMHIFSIFSMDYENKIWRLVGLISCVIGLAYSIFSTGELIIAWRFFIYGVLITGYLIVILFAEQSSRFVRNVWNKIKGFSIWMQTLQSSSQVLQTSPVVPDVAQGSQRDTLALRVSQRDPRDPLPIPLMHILSMDYKNNIWRIVGLMSSVVGLSCFALSPSFGRLIRGWNAWKFILYEVFSLVVLIAFLSAEQSTRSVGHVWFKIKGFAILMFIAVYAFYYDKAVDGKPEILSLVSNAAFALMSLCYSKLTKYAHEMGVFSFFLSCLTVQLWIINWMLIFVAICFGFPLFVLHSSSEPRISLHIPV